ncbi:MAG: DUF167 domain-containing protein [Phycisphaerae bacterium]|nr:DUF167 domain-containing protein [Phycisphaerae bacterium]
MKRLDTYYRWDGGNLILQLKVHAGAKVAAWGKVLGGHILVHVPAAPEKGRATARLLRFLADEFAVPTANVQLIRGAFSPLKVVRIINPGTLNDSTGIPPTAR